MRRDDLSASEAALFGAAVLLCLAVCVVWAGAALALAARGTAPSFSAGEAVDATLRLPSSLGDPATAWSPHVARRLPGPIPYWTATALAAVAIGTCAGLAVRFVPLGRVGSERRRPLGVNARPRFATSRDLRPVLVRRSAPGRFTIARFGTRLVATEAREPSRRSRRRTGDRGAVALVGPSRSGKTTAAVAGVLEWEGPAVLSSVKADLLAETAGWRTTCGEVRVYDPTGTTSSGPRPARWSPVDQARTVIGSQRSARALCDAAPKTGVEGGLDFWLAQAEILLSGLLYLAHHSLRDMGVVCDWVLLQDQPGELGPGEVRATLDHLTEHGPPEVAAGAAEAGRGLRAIWEMDERTRSSVYATAQTLVWPWSEPGVAASAMDLGGGDRVDLPWLLSGDNTLYLCAPLEDQQRLAPAFGGLLGDLIGQVYRHVATTGRPLDPPLLILIDEAGNTPLRALPSYASTLAGLGVLLITVWQSIAQIEVAYGRSADTVLTNHLSKVFYAGLSDGASLRYIGQVLGDAEVVTRARTITDGTNHGSQQLSAARSPLAPPHALRQMRPGDALLLHGTLPPAHVRARPYYRTPRLRERARQPWPPAEEPKA